jgi:hypothetical protein
MKTTSVLFIARGSWCKSSEKEGPDLVGIIKCALSHATRAYILEDSMRCHSIISLKISPKLTDEAFWRFSKQTLVK